jgi:hypothetical protein
MPICNCGVRYDAECKCVAYVKADCQVLKSAKAGMSLRTSVGTLFDCGTLSGKIAAPRIIVVPEPGVYRYFSVTPSCLVYAIATHSRIFATYTRVLCKNATCDACLVRLR